MGRATLLSSADSALLELSFGQADWIVRIEREAGWARRPHWHDKGRKVLVESGAVTVVRNGEERTFRAGESYDVGANEIHEERCGPEGAVVVIGRARP